MPREHRVAALRRRRAGMGLAAVVPMPSIKPPIILALVTALTSVAAAEKLTGQVLDRASGQAIEGAVVNIADAAGASLTTTSAADGSYGFDVRPGRYQVTFLYGHARKVATVVVTDGAPAQLTGRLDGEVGEVIILDEAHRPAVAPEPIRSISDIRTPPYSDRAILEDAWTRAWLLLDVDERGAVTRLKFLKRPGFDLEPHAIAEGFKLKFRPARDDQGRAVSTYVLWPIEWPAQSWLRYAQGQTTRMPELKLNGYNKTAYVPCAGSGPWSMDSIYKGYRDCTRPDLAAAKRESWIVQVR